MRNKWVESQLPNGESGSDVLLIAIYTSLKSQSLQLVSYSCDFSD